MEGTQAACQPPVLGPRQPFPQRCTACGELFSRGDPVTMLPVLHEGDVLSVGRWPNLNGDYAPKAEPGKVLWAAWLCSLCSNLSRTTFVIEAVPEVVSEPPELRRQRLRAENELAHRAIAAGRQRAVARARANRYRSSQ